MNCSPKGNRGEFAVLGRHRVAYLDQTGSGVETISHLRENGRIILMFTAFEGPPRIVRLHGRGRPVLPGEEGFVDLVPLFAPPSATGVRSVIVVDVHRVADSCGYGVPLMEFRGHRPQLDAWAERKGPEGVRRYWADTNARGIDGLAGMQG